MNQVNLTRLTGYNNNSGVLHYTQNGMRQFAFNKNVIPAPGLNIETYTNNKNEKELLDNMNALRRPNYYRGKKEEIKYAPVYAPPPNQPVVGGNTQEQLDRKLKK